jgi:hypothetical protein
MIDSLPENFFVLLAGIILVGVIIFLAFLTFRQHRQIVELQRPKYGFLGKPIYSLVAVLFVIGIVGIVFRPSAPDNGIDVSQNYKIKLEIKQAVIDQDDTLARVRFTMIPLVNGLTWGYATDSFSPEWTITNLVTGKVIEDREAKLSMANPGGLLVDLPLGSYSAEVKITYMGGVFTNKVYFQL